MYYTKEQRVDRFKRRASIGDRLSPIERLEALGIWSASFILLGFVLVAHTR